LSDTIDSKEIVLSSFKLSKNGLEAIGSPTFEEWKKVGKWLSNASGAVHFWIGDWLNYGELKFNETYKLVMEQTGYEIQTLRNDKYIASRIPTERRRNSLSFDHHAQVASLTAEEQEEMLNLAEEKKLTRDELRKAVRRYNIRLDLPELSEEELEPNPADFKKAQEMVIMLIEVTEEVKNLNWDSLNEDARDYLIAQIKKTVGALAGVVIKGGESLPSGSN